MHSSKGPSGPRHLSEVVIAFGARARRTLAAMQPAALRNYRRDRALNRLVRRLAATGLFDERFYLSRNPDVAASGEDPIRHYLTHGAAEGRDPHPMFDTSYYLRQNPDVVRVGTNPLLHFALSGLSEGRRPHPGFSVDQFRDAMTRGGRRLGREVRASARARTAAEATNRRRAGRPFRFRPERLPTPEQGQTLESSAPSDRAANRLISPTIVVSHVLPYPPRAGNEFRIHQLCRWLHSTGHELYLIVSPLPGTAPDVRSIRAAAAVYPNLVVCQRDGTLLHRSARPDVDSMLDGLAGMRPRSFPPIKEQAGRRERITSIELAFCPDHLLDLLLRLERTVRPEMVVATYVFMSRCLPLLARGVLRVLDTIDVFSTKTEKVVQFGVADDLALTREEEATLLRRADLLVAIQPSEEEDLRALAPDRPVVTAGVDFPLVDGHGAPSGDPAVLYVASKNALNVKGIRDFLAFAWPLIRRDVPRARLLVAGPICEVVDGQVPGVELLGQVDRLDDLYAEARVVVNLAVAGTGLKVKTVESLAHLRPIVLWPCGIDGLSPDIARFCDVASNWYDFARRVIRQLRVEQIELTTHRAEISRQLSPQVVYASLGKAIAEGLRRAAAREVHLE